MAIQHRMGDNAKYAQYDSRPCWKILLKLCFSHIGLLVLVGVVAVLGAYMFIDLELPAEERRKTLKVIKAKDIQDSINYLSDYFWVYAGSLEGTEIENKANWSQTFKEEIKLLEEFIISGVEDNKYDGTVTNWDYDWTFSKSLLFTISIMTTIGYGHITPKTFLGKIMVMIYFVMSAPLMLVFLANIGDSMANSFKYIYSRFCCRVFRSRRKKSELPPGAPLKGNRLIDETVGSEEYMPTNEVHVPIVLNLVIILIYIMIGACMFSYWEKWDMATASYFTFVTLSTIGFGDFVPGNSFLGYTDSFSATVAMITNVLYCLFGMALLSMCINLMQEQIFMKCKWLARELGLSEGDNDDKPVPVYILREEARRAKKKTMATPKDKTGNKATIKKPKKKVTLSDF